MCYLKVESYVFLSGHSKDSKTGRQKSQTALRNCSKDAKGQEQKEGPGYIRVFATRDQVVGTSKDYS